MQYFFMVIFGQPDELTSYGFILQNQVFNISLVFKIYKTGERASDLARCATHSNR